MMRRENIRELTEREQELLAPDVGGYLQARQVLQQARQAKADLWDRINRTASLLCPEEENVYLDLESLMLYREVPSEGGADTEG